jgi:hypothetical protein
MKAIETNQLFSISSDEDFTAMALQVFQYQYKNNIIYNNYVKALGLDITGITRREHIPFLPIEFFKTREIISGEKNESTVIFTSSSTTSQTPSKHFVTDIGLYEKSFLEGFKRFYTEPTELVILALLPNYLQRTGSSLVYMFDKLIQLSKNKRSGSFLNDYDELKTRIEELRSKKQRTLLLGVSYALLDLAEMNVKLGDNFIVMETGGMKGKRKELLKEELHSILTGKFEVKTIHSEYGMTELLSQAYSKGNGIFECPPWMKVMVRDIDDPLTMAKPDSTGGINVIDLANINSCSFIATQDLGRVRENGSFELMGRFDASDVRGCNLMIG